MLILLSIKDGMGKYVQLGLRELPPVATLNCKMEAMKLSLVLKCLTTLDIG